MELIFRGISWTKPNQLIKEKSSYLLQRAYNPVDWHPWGDEACSCFGPGALDRIKQHFAGRCIVDCYQTNTMAEGYAAAGLFA